MAVKVLLLYSVSRGKDLLFVCACSPHRGRYLQRLEKVLDPQELELQL